MTRYCTLHNLAITTIHTLQFSPHALHLRRKTEIPKDSSIPIPMRV